MRNMLRALAEQAPSRIWTAIVAGVMLTGSGCVTSERMDTPAYHIDPDEYCGGKCWPGESWAQPGPVALGWSEEAIDHVRKQYRRIGSDALMIVDRGIVVVQWGATSRNHAVQSVRKSFLSGLYGIFEAEGKTDLSLSLAELGIDDSVPPSLTDLEKTATLTQLIKARSGVYHEAAAESPSMKDLRPERGTHEPGTFYYYNNWDFNALGTAFMQLTGEDIFEALYERIAVPIGMQDFVVSDCWYKYEPVSDHPAYHIYMSARDMARYGLLFARNGKWQGKTIIPEEWINESTTGYSDTESAFRYGYMWSVGKPEEFRGHRMFATLGGSGHGIFIFPDIDLVVVHRVNPSTYPFGWDEVLELLDLVLRAR